MSCPLKSRSRKLPAGIQSAIADGDQLAGNQADDSVLGEVRLEGLSGSRKWTVRRTCLVRCDLFVPVKEKKRAVEQYVDPRGAGQTGSKTLEPRFKGFFRKSKLHRAAQEAVEKSLKYGYVGRRLKKRDFRSFVDCTASVQPAARPTFPIAVSWTG